MLVSRITRRATLAALVCASALSGSSAGHAVAAPSAGPERPASAAVQRALAQEKYYSSYGEPDPAAAEPQQSQSLWLLAPTASAALLLGAAAGAGVQRSRLQRVSRATT